MNPPSFSYRTQVTYNTSNAGSTHFLRYIDGITSGLDFEFAFKVCFELGRGGEVRVFNWSLQGRMRRFDFFAFT